MSYEWKELKDNTQIKLIEFSQFPPLTQSWQYKSWQESVNREVFCFGVYSQEVICAYMQIIVYPLIAGQKIAYIPYGPLFKTPTLDLLKFIKEQLKIFAKKNNISFIKLDSSSENLDIKIWNKVFSRELISSHKIAYLQPRIEWYLDISKSEMDLLKEMHEKARYGISLSKRKGIEVKIITENFSEYFQDFIDLMKMTANRNNFSIHAEEYYKNIFEDLEKNKNGYLGIGYYQDKILVINIVILCENTATYIFGASSDEHKNLMAPHLVQWTQILEAKKRGIQYYNFGGVSGGNKKLKSWEGLSVFKVRFGGFELKHEMLSDLVAKPCIYFLYLFKQLFKR
jgi:peptidoglycan pentaglycine glycine transferase (the first glycine)